MELLPLSSIELTVETMARGNKELMDELAVSIKEHGLMNPLTVMRVYGKIFILDGAKRYRICQSLGWETITCRVVGE